MNLFEAVKESVTARQAAERYGIEIDRAGKACCIFHEDHHPSMKVDERFHCFACGADGDAIDLVAQLFGLSLKDAAKRLAEDLQLAYDRGQSKQQSAKTAQLKAHKSLMQRLKDCQNETYHILCNYFRLLRQWETDYAPKLEDQEWHPLYLEAVQNSARVEYLLDELMNCSPEKAKESIALHKSQIGRYANRVKQVRRTEKHVTCEMNFK